MILSFISVVLFTVRRMQSAASLDFSYRLTGVNGAGVGWLVMSIVAGGYDKLPGVAGWAGFPKAGGVFR
ncbi:MAG TPA: hypothetical protein VMU34_02145, partial [Mycobacterium sp.]|nr:hypothetical protein [Mycobacterium sp.]